MDDIKGILVTGATGFLGSHLLDLLIKEGYKPIIFLRESSDVWRIRHLQNKYETFVSKDNSDEDIQSLFAKHHIQAIIHMATEYGRQIALSDILQTNVLFPLRLIEAGLKHNLQLFINSDTFFGKKQFNLKYLNNYTTSKRIFESVLTGLSSNLNIANMRIEHVYGENDSETKFVTNVLKQAIQNKSEILLTEGLQKRDFVYAADVANAYVTVLRQNKFITGYNEFEVGTGQSISVKEFVTTIADITNSVSFLNFGAVPVHSGEISDSSANITALKDLGWSPQYDLDTALRKIILTEKKRFTDEH